MDKLLYCEFLKLKRTKIKMIVLLGILVPPILALFSSVQHYLLNPEQEVSLFTLYDNAFMFLMLLFGPLVFSVIGAHLFSREYTEKTLKTILVIPVTRKKFISGKFLALFMDVLILMLFFWLSILILYAGCNLTIGAEQFYFGTVLVYFIRVVIGGILLFCTVVPIAAIAFRTKGIITSIIVIAIIALINVIFSGSSLAGFFPWSAAYLIATGRMSNTICPLPVSLIIIFLVAFVSYRYCCKEFEKEDIN